MALVDFKLLPGIDKQQTQVGAERRWVDSDNVRFRYGLPEKLGGWSSLLTDTIVGVARAQFPFVDLDGNRYVAIGTDKFLLIYYEGQLYDITPLATTISSATFTFNGTTTITMTTSSAHGLLAGDIILFDSVTLPGGTGLTDAAFEDKLFQVITVPTSVTFTITFTSTGSSATGGSVDLKPYASVGPAAQTYGYGFGVGNFGGTISGVATTDLDGTLGDNTSGTTGTTIAVTSATGFPSAGGTIIVSDTPAVDGELIDYTAVSTNNLTVITRAVDGSDRSAHADEVAVADATDYTGWGSAVTASNVTLEPGLWALDNYGDVLLATILNGKTYTWDSSIAARFTTRASTGTTSYVTTSAPTASRAMMMSPVTRHLVLFGTETTIADTSTQDDMFIRFSDQETINDFAPTAINSAGSQRLQDGTKIMGAIKAKYNILVWTGTSLYTMKRVGTSFTFGF